MNIDRIRALVARIEGMDQRGRVVRDYRRAVIDFTRQRPDAGTDKIKAVAAAVASCESLRKRNRQRGHGKRQYDLQSTFDDEKIAALMRLRDELLSELGLTAPSR